MDIKDRVLVIEDDKSIRNFFRTVLEANNYDVLIATTGAEGYSMVTSQCPDVVILDLGLPDMDGMKILKEVRAWSNMPIIVVSARDHEKDKVEALDMGADDYITKPFNPLELVARVKTQLRRYTRYNNSTGVVENKQTEEYDICSLHIEKESHLCTLNGKELSLTPIEFSILWYLCERRGKVVSSEELFEAVWGEKYLDNNNTVMAHIARLREKLNEPARKPRFVKTVWGVGYKIE